MEVVPGLAVQAKAPADAVELASVALKDLASEGLKEQAWAVLKDQGNLAAA